MEDNSWETKVNFKWVLKMWIGITWIIRHCVRGRCEHGTGYLSITKLRQ